MYFSISRNGLYITELFLKTLESSWKNFTTKQYLHLWIKKKAKSSIMNQQDFVVY